MNTFKAPSQPCRVVLITGAAHRIGRECALAFARAGWRVGVHYRSSAESAHAVADEIRKLGGEAEALSADLAEPDQLRALIPECIMKIGAPSCLINNASLFLKDELDTVDAENWQAHMDANLRAPVMLAQSFAIYLPEGVPGNIINVVDQRVLRPSPEFFSYSVSKAGLWWVTQTMAQALAPRIRVNAVAPGPVLRSIHQSEDDFAAEESATLLGHGASPEDIASAMLYLVEARAVTGQMICVDSGQHLTDSHQLI